MGAGSVAGDMAVVVHAVGRDQRRDITGAEGALVGQVQFGPAAGVVDRVPPLVRFHSAHRGECRPSPLPAGEPAPAGARARAEPAGAPRAPRRAFARSAGRRSPRRRPARPAAAPPAPCPQPHRPADQPARPGSGGQGREQRRYSPRPPMPGSAWLLPTSWSLLPAATSPANDPTGWVAQLASPYEG